MSEIILYQYGGIARGATLSAPCAKAQMGLRFKGLEYTTRDLLTPGAVKKVNPRGRMPALSIDGEITVDSSDILTRLDAHTPDPPLLPPDPLSRALVKFLEDWADEVIYFYTAYLRWCVQANFDRLSAAVFKTMPAPLCWIVPRFARRDALNRFRGQGVALKSEDVVRRELGECLDALETFAGAGPYLVGEAPRRADLAVAAVIDQLAMAELTPGGAAEVERRPAIMAWLERVHAHAPSAARAVAAEAAEL